MCSGSQLRRMSWKLSTRLRQRETPDLSLTAAEMGKGWQETRVPSCSDPLPSQPVPPDHPAAPFAPGWAPDRLCLLHPGAAAPARSPSYLPTPTLCSLEDMIISQITKHQEQLCNLLGSLLHLLILKYFNGPFIAVLKSSERQ